MYLEIENNRSRKTVDASCPLLSDVCSDFHKINLFFFFLSYAKTITDALSCFSSGQHVLKPLRSHFLGSAVTIDVFFSN